MLYLILPQETRPASASTLRYAFSLIELLIVIAILAILIGLLIPAIQQSRASAANTQCRNNLKNIGTALHGYYARMKHFPPGYQDMNADPKSDASYDRGPGWGWAALLLADLEQDSIFRQINLSQTVGINPVCQTFLPLFWCPADDQLPTFPVYDTANPPSPVPLAVVAQGNYIANNGTKETSIYPGSNNGAFLRNRKIKIGDIADGVSNTVFIGERNSGHSKTTWTGAVPGGSVPALQSSDPLGNAEYASALVLGHGSRDHLPNDPNLTDADVFYSRHPQGVNFLFGDGSVRTISSGINGITFENLLNRADGHFINLDF